MPWGVSIYFFMAIPKGRLSSYVVGHVVGEHDREFYESGYFSVATPGGLVDYFALTVFLDGIGIVVAGFEHVAYLTLSKFGVIREEVVADDVAIFGESGTRAVVHIENFGVGVADCHSGVDFVGPVEEAFRYFSHDFQS